MAYSSTIIDPHIHLWDPRQTPRPASPFVRLLGWNRRLLHTVTSRVLPAATRDFVGHPEHLLAPYLPPDYASDRAHHRVEGYVYVEAGWHGRGQLAAADETRWVEKIAQRYDSEGPRLVAIVAKADLRRPDLADVLQAHREASPRVRGVRDMLAWCSDRGVMDYAPAPNLIGDPTWRRGFASLAEHDLSFDAWLYLDQVNALDDLLRDNPRVPVVLDHLATPIAAGGPFAGRGGDESSQAMIRTRWRDAISRLAEHSQLYVKLSGMFMPVLGWGLHTRNSPVSTSQVRDALAPFVEHTLDRFGVERCMFASNFPMDKVSLGFGQLYDAYHQLVQDRPAAEQQALFRDNALRFYGVSNGNEVA